jgi:hypothetical protein
MEPYGRGWYSVRTAVFSMAKRRTCTDNSLAPVFDKPMLDGFRIDANTPLEVSTDGEVIIVSPLFGTGGAPRGSRRL